MTTPPGAGGGDAAESAAAPPTSASPEMPVLSALPTAVASMVGSLPGTDITEAVATVAGELPDFPAVPELPARGLGADLTGRGVAVLTDLPADVQPSGWRLTPAPGLDLRRARDLLERDLDAVGAGLTGLTAPLKIAVAGPWTLAATVELPRGDRVLADPGAVRDLAQSLADGVGRLVAALRLRVPDAPLVVQLDEPELPRVLLGRVPTASGFGTVPAVESPVAAARLAEVLRAVSATGALPVVHCCAPRPPVELLRGAGAAAVSLDATLLDKRDDEELGAAVESGLRLLLGVVPAAATSGPAVLSHPRVMLRPVFAIWRRLGFPPPRLADVAAVTPTCGLAGASASHARASLRASRQIAQQLRDDPE